MPEAIKHPMTGCRYDTILGDWLIPEDRLQRFVDLGWAVLDKGELQSFSARSQEMAEAADDKPYTVSDGVARIKLSGPISKMDTSLSSLFGGTSSFRVRKALVDLRSRADAGEIKAVFLEVDSPGGTVDGTAELAKAIRLTAEKMPVHAHAEDMACSAALWVATQATRFTAGPVALIGSLGVRVTLMDQSKASEGATVKPVVIDTGKYKSIGAPGKPITDDQLAEMQRHAENIAAVFKHDVGTARGMSSIQMNEAATARVFVGKDAKRVGLIDDVCSSDEAYDSLKTAIKTPHPARRGPGMQDKPVAAPSRSTAMPYSAAQLEQLRKLPGAANVTDANAEETALNCAVQTTQQLSTALNEQSTLRAQVLSLGEEVKAAKAVVSTQKIDPSVLRDRAQAAIERLQIRVEKGQMTTAQYNKASALLLIAGNAKDFQLSADAKPNEAMFQRSADNGPYVYQQVLAIFDEPSPAGQQLLGSATGSQTAPRSEPGEQPKANADVPEGWGLAKCNEFRTKHGHGPFTQAEFDVQYPECRGKP